MVFVSAELLAKTEGYGQKEIELALKISSEGSGDEAAVLTARLDRSDTPLALSHLKSVDLFEAGGEERLVGLIREELDIFTDPRDGQTYRMIRVGNHDWFAENLRYEAEGSFCYKNERRRGDMHGRLYPFEVAHAACPSGWRLPDDEEWAQLALEFGGYHDMDRVGDPLERRGKPLLAFESLTTGGRSGFDASLGGLRCSDGSFKFLWQAGFYWSSSEREYHSSYSDFADISHLELDFRGPGLAFPASFTVETAWFYYFYIVGGQPELRRAYQIPMQPDPRPRSCGFSVRYLRDSPVR